MTEKEARSELLSRRKEIVEVLNLIANCCPVFQCGKYHNCPFQLKDETYCPICEYPENWIISEEMSAEEVPE